MLTGVDFLDQRKTVRRHAHRPDLARLGTAEEWTLINTSPESHPFHIHVNSFEVVSINGVAPATTRYVDTVLIPPNGQVVFRSRFKQFAGKSVYHCHILPHEDTGMMGNLMLV